MFDSTVIRIQQSNLDWLAKVDAKTMQENNVSYIMTT